MKIVFVIFGNFFDVDSPCSLINEETLIEYSLYLQDIDIKKTTQSTYFRNIRVFLYYCMKLGYVKKFEIQVKTVTSFKEVYTEQELSLLIKKPNIKKCNFEEYRNWVLTCFLLGTAARVQTVAEVLIGDIDFDNNQIALKRVKNGIPYCIPLSLSLAGIMHEYLAFRKGKKEDHVFCTGEGVPLKKNGIQQALRKYNRKRGVMKTSVHLYRHTFVKNWLLDEGSIYELQQILGHKTLSMVLRYANYYGVDLKKNFDTHNIFEKLSTTGKRIKMR